MNAPTQAPSKEKLTLTGISRDAGCPASLQLFFNREPSDDEMRAVHESMRRASNEPLPECSQCDELIGERDRAQDALQETHIALGGDGEWVAKMPSEPPPDSGDLHLDVPELARERMAELETLKTLEGAARRAFVNVAIRASQPPLPVLPDAILNVAELLRTQNNRATNAPIFLVERKRRVYGIDPEWGGEVVWLRDGSEITDAEELKQLEEGHENGDDEPDNHTRTSYADHWEFVTACFTEEGCKSFLRRDGHNHGETRIYAAGSYRNAEWNAVRDYLMSQRPCSAATKCAGQS